MFLHRILQLDETDPVWKTFVSMKSLHEAGENNWWTGVNKIVNKYGLSDLGKLKKATKDTFLKKVKRIIMESAFETLKAECKPKPWSMSPLLYKTTSLNCIQLKQGSSLNGDRKHWTSSHMQHINFRIQYVEVARAKSKILLISLIAEMKKYII